MEHAQATFSIEEVGPMFTEPTPSVPFWFWTASALAILIPILLSWLVLNKQRAWQNPKRKSSILLVVIGLLMVEFLIIKLWLYIVGNIALS